MKMTFTILLLVILTGIVYEVWHIWRLTPGFWPLKLTVVGLFVLWFGIMMAGFLYTERFSVGFATFLYEAGNPWLVAFVYLLILFLLADMASACRILPKSFMDNNVAGFVTVLVLIVSVMTAGYIHYHHKYREELTIHTDKPLDKPMTIVLASDLHIGYHNRRTELGRWIDMINAETPDMVLIGGDIVDRSVRTVMEGGFAGEFSRLKAPIWTILGNHEYYSDVDGARKFLSDAGIVLLRDSVINYGGIQVIGRDDRTNRNRKHLSELRRDSDSDLFTILLDHQPYHLEEAENAGIDFQFSGHTHRGQFWPISWITDAMYEKSWGHHQRGGTRYYISSGLGIWGPKIRIGSRSEYLVLRISN